MIVCISTTAPSDSYRVMHPVQRSYTYVAPSFIETAMLKCNGSSSDGSSDLSNKPFRRCLQVDWGALDLPQQSQEELERGRLSFSFFLHLHPYCLCQTVYLKRMPKIVDANNEGVGHNQVHRHNKLWYNIRRITYIVSILIHNRFYCEQISKCCAVFAPVSDGDFQWLRFS